MVRTTGWLGLRGWAVAAACLAGQIALNLQLRASRVDYRPTAAESERALRINAELFKAVWLGNWPAGVDWLWITVLLDGDGSKAAIGEHPALYRTLDLATDLDPAYFDAYSGGANLLAVLRNDGVGARDLLLKAERFRKEALPSLPSSFQERYWPNPWTIPLLLAYVHLFELQDLPRAAENFLEASRVPGGPPYLASLAQRLRQPGGEYEVALRLVGMMRKASQDGRVSAELDEKARSLEIARFLDQVNRSFRAYQEAKGKGPSAWPDFLRDTGAPARDPEGGELFVDGNGKVASPTPRVKVFGLE